MKILHTADWHVGKTLRGRSRAAEHEAVLAEIAGIAREESVDLVLVAGDLFDTAAPGPDAERLVWRALLDLAGTGAAVAIVSGNHDNDRRLTAVEPLLRLGQVVTRSTLAAPGDGGVFSFETRAGERAGVALLPFLSQRYIVRADDLMSLDPDQHQGRYSERVRRIIERMCEGMAEDGVNVLAGHMLVTGGAVGGGERPAHTIPGYSVSATAFPASLHYVALGHLHRPQRLPGPCPIRYSGSPLALDFGEGSDEKSVVVVEASSGRPAEVREIPLRSGRRLRTVEGTLSELSKLAAGCGEEFLRVRVREDPRTGIAREVRQMLPNAVDVVVDSGAPPATPRRPERAGRSPHELFAEYLAERGGVDERVVALFDRLLEEAHAADPS
ncbi:MAG: exonuclease SbcCD subunit D [Acidobacteria bacterium]|nr:exonuclease SbcCD subunit D [Acidobacteriota bacterium]